MNKYEKHLKRENMSEGKGLFSIIAGFFNDLTKNIKLGKDTNKVRKACQKKLNDLPEKDGVISVKDANNLMDEYIAELEAMGRKSGMSQRAIDRYIETINKERKHW